MAYIIPSDITQPILSGSHAYELETLKELKNGLSNDYTVFHSVHWSFEKPRFTVVGEIDFVIVNRSGDVLVIEQKNGPLQETDRGLVKRYFDNEKNVADQVHRSLDNVRDKFGRQHSKERKLSLDYLIYCPDHKIIKINAPGLDSSRIVGAGDKVGLCGRIAEILGPGSGADKTWAETVRGFFCQSFEVVPDIHAYIGAQHRTFTRLSGGLVKVIDNLEMSPFRLRIMGVAGCGKSQLAHHVFEKAINNGKRPLLVCFNRPLSERFKVSVKEGGAVHTWHGLCDTFLKQQGHKLDYQTMSEDPDFWKKVEERVVEATVPDEWLFDTLIVDEGQDFTQEWYEILKLFLKDRADILWFEDPSQNIRKTSAIEDDAFVIYHANDNYRTPQRIAQFIQKTLPYSFNCANELPGLGVGIHPYSKDLELVKSVDSVVRDLRKSGFQYGDIIILCCRGLASSKFNTLDKVAGVKLQKFTGEYDNHGNQTLTEGDIRFDSVYRFKGQQSPAVILVEVDPDAKHLDTAQRILYSGMTRATVRLDMVVNSGNPENKSFIAYK